MGQEEYSEIEFKKMLQNLFLEKKKVKDLQKKIHSLGSERNQLREQLDSAKSAGSGTVQLDVAERDQKIFALTEESSQLRKALDAANSRIKGLKEAHDKERENFVASGEKDIKEHLGAKEQKELLAETLGRLKELEATDQSLRDDNQRLRQALQVLKGKHDRNLAEYQKAVGDKGFSLSQELKTAQGKLEKLRKIVQDQRTESREKAHQLEIERKDNSSLASQMEEYKKVAEKAEADLKQGLEKSQTLQQENAALRRELDAVKGQLTEAQEKQQGLRIHADNVQSILPEKVDYRVLAQTFCTSTKRLAEVRWTVAHRKEAEDWASKAEAVSPAFREAFSQMGKINALVDALWKKVDAGSHVPPFMLKDTLGALQKSLNRTALFFLNLGERLQEEVEGQEEVAQRFSQLQKILNEKADEIQRLESVIAAKQENEHLLKGSLQESVNKISSLEESSNSSSGEIAKIQEELDSTQERLQQSLLKLSSSQEATAKAEERSKELQQSVEKLQAQVQLSRQEILEKNEKLESIEGQLKLIQEGNGNLEKEKLAYQEICQQLQERLKITEESLEKANTQLNQTVGEQLALDRNSGMLQAKVTELETAKEELQKEVERLLEEKKTLETDFQVARDGLIDSKQKLRESEESQVHFTEEKDRIQGTLEALQEILQLTQNELKEARRELGESQRLCAELEEEKRQLERPQPIQAQSTSSEEEGRAQMALRSTLEKLREISARHSELQDQNRMLKAEIDLRQKNSEDQQDASESLAQLKALENRYVKECSALRQMVEKKSRTIEKARKIIEELKLNQQKLESKIRVLGKVARDAEARSAEIRDEKDHLGREMDDSLQQKSSALLEAERKVLRLQSENETLHQELARREKSLIKEEERCQELTTELREKENNSREISHTLRELTVEKNAIEKALNVAEDRLEKNSQQIGDLKTELFEVQQEAKENKAKFQNSHRASEDLEQHIGQLEIKIEEERKARNTLHKKLEAEIEEEKRSKEILYKQLETNKAQLQESSQQKSDLQTRINKLQQDLSQYSALRDEYVAVKKRWEASKKELETVKAEYLEELSNKDELLQQTEANLEIALAKNKEKVLSITQERDSALKKAQEKYQELLAEESKKAEQFKIEGDQALTTLERELREENQRLEKEHQEELAKLCKEAESYQERIQNLEAENSEKKQVQEKLERLEKDFKALTDRFQNVSTRYQDSETATQDLNRSLEERNQDISNKTKEIKALCEQVEELKQNFEDQKKRVEEAEQKATVAHKYAAKKIKENTLYGDILKAERLKTQQMKAKITELQNDLRRESSHQEKLQGIATERVQIAEKQAKELQEKLELAESKMGSLETKVQELEKIEEDYHKLNAACQSLKSLMGNGAGLEGSTPAASSPKIAPETIIQPITLPEKEETESTVEADKGLDDLFSATKTESRASQSSGGGLFDF